MSLLNLGSDGENQLTVPQRRALGKELGLITTEEFEYGPKRAKTEKLSAEAYKITAETAKERAEMEKRMLPFEVSGAARTEVSGWAKIVKIGLVIALGLFLVLGSFAAVESIWNFIEPYWYIYLGAFVLITIIWIKRR